MRQDLKMASELDMDVSGSGALQAGEAGLARSGTEEASVTEGERARVYRCPGSRTVSTDAEVPYVKYCTTGGPLYPWVLHPRDEVRKVMGAIMRQVVQDVVCTSAFTLSGTGAIGIFGAEE